MNSKNPEEEESWSNEGGLTVFTREFLLQRGYCCGCGCRNCPYEYSAVPEPRRSELRTLQTLRNMPGGAGTDQI